MCEREGGREGNRESMMPSAVVRLHLEHKIKDTNVIIAITIKYTN